MNPLDFNCSAIALILNPSLEYAKMIASHSEAIDLGIFNKNEKADAWKEAGEKVKGCVDFIFISERRSSR
jgi:hypothetical protein